MTFGVHPSHEMSPKSEALCETTHVERHAGFISSECSVPHAPLLPLHHILVY